jgi:RNA polymerase sigma-70 factor (ECF subfamily)
VVNLAIDLVRRRRRAAAPYDDQRAVGDEPAAEVPAAGDPGSALQLKQVRALLAQGLEALPPAHRAVLVLREIEGMSYDAIAQTVGCSPGTVMSRLFYARRKLQQALKAHLGDLR